MGDSLVGLNPQPVGSDAISNQLVSENCLWLRVVVLKLMSEHLKTP